MEGFIIFVCIVAGLVWLARYMRQREIERFMDADVGDFQLHSTNEAVEKEDPILARAEVAAALNPDIGPIKRPEAAAADPIPIDITDAPDPVLYVAKGATLDDVNRALFLALSGAVPPSMRLLTNIPLTEIAKAPDASGTEAARLKSTVISYLICSATDLKPLCGVRLSSRPDFMKGVFGDLGIPLIEFPPSPDISVEEARVRLVDVLGKRESQICPKCGEGMTIRKAVKGKDAGMSFWVCKGFPRCRGVLKQEPAL